MFNFVNLSGLSIFEQLQIEEALLRTDDSNWCLLNTNARDAIVMGISGKPEKFIDIKKVSQAKIPVIKRFSGGGTVFIDKDTIFVTFISNAPSTVTPRFILEWTKKVYAPFFPSFALKENDYTFGDKKFGGNAQYIQKNRWLHHTSFLWDYNVEKMKLLLLPEKRPIYRKNRDHEEFLCTLKSLFSKKERLMNSLSEYLLEVLPAKEISLSCAYPCLSKDHRKATTLISI